jgi:transcriptional regulator with XRE-family HTH domain
MKNMDNRAKYRIREILSNVPKSEFPHAKKELCNILGITVQGLSNLLNGRSDWSGTKLRLVADYFGVPVDELYQKDEARAAHAERA